MLEGGDGRLHADLVDNQPVVVHTIRSSDRQAGRKVVIDFREELVAEV
jgi:hypothetical protein